MLRRTAARGGAETAHLDFAALPDPALLHGPLAIGMEEKLGALERSANQRGLSAAAAAAWAWGARTAPVSSWRTRSYKKRMRRSRATMRSKSGGARSAVAKLSAHGPQRRGLESCGAATHTCR